METKKVKLIYFSPTGTSRRVLEGIAQGIGVEDVELIDLTPPENTHRSITARPDDLVLIGTPVYGGRLPVDAIARLRQLKAENSLAVLVVTYGNREFDDALLELKHLAIELGCTPIAGGAFIGEHSFASKKVPVANGRPDDLDLHTAATFGNKIKEKVSTLQASTTQIDLEVPGSFPYKAEGARAMAVSPVTREDSCTLCGTCANVCPTAAISINGRVITEVEKCIRCCACIKNCPEGARVIEDETWECITKWLHENCKSRKEPQMFGVVRGGATILDKLLSG
jgi:ferredoxin/flavodoxin